MDYFTDGFINAYTEAREETKRILELAWNKITKKCR